MSKEKIDLSNIALHISSDSIDRTGRDCATWTLRFVVVTPEGKVRNLDGSTRGSRMFSALKFHSQWEPARPDRGVYAQSLSLRDIRDTARVSDVEELLEILKKAHKIHASLPVRPSSFGQFVVLMCQGIKIKRVVIRGERVNNSGWSQYDDYEYRESKVDTSLQNEIDDIIQETFASAEVAR
jgi:hypothetical protein